MRKLILCLGVLLWSAGASAALLNDADAFVVARSAKLGEMDDSFDAFKKVNKKLGCAPGETDCVGPTLCKTDSHCKDDEYCAKTKKCVKLCSGGVNSDGEKCSDYPRMPECEPKKTGHQSYCACTETSCGEGWKCVEQSGMKQCVSCSAGEACGCPDGKTANGKGGCGGCNSNDDCAGNEICVGAGTTEAECKPVNCSAGTFPKDHDCAECSALDPNCLECTETQCTACLPAYDLVNGKCVLKTCPDGQYLDELTGTCNPCAAGCKKCTAADACIECEAAYDLENGMCKAKDCGEGMYLNAETGECLSCPAECATCTNVANSSETTQCVTCADGYHMENGICVANGCADMNLATECAANEKKTAAGTATNGEQCYTCEPQCRKDADCDGTQKCSPDGECVLKTCAEMGYETSCPAGNLKNEAAVGSDGMCYTCQNPAKDCPADKPAWDGKKCVQCTANSHCESYEYCKDNQCVLQAGKCYTSNDCTNADYCKDHSCVPACDPNPCSGQQPRCVGSSHSYFCTCTSTSCPSGYSCNGDSPFDCKSNTCKSDNDCVAKKMCSGGKCVDPCDPNPCSGKTPKCLTVTHKPVCYCTTTSCGEGYECETTRCKPLTCKTNADCHDKKMCSGGKCVDPCEKNPCSGQQPRCVSSNHSYFCSCTSKSCPSGYMCSSNSPFNCKVATTEKCTTDDDCSADKKCSDGYCVYRE